MKLYLATGNAHKIGEVLAILAAAGLEIDVSGPGELGGMPPVDEDAVTFAGNALRKARALSAKLGSVGREAWAMADDSGLCVDALGGGPGVISARYAGPEASDAENTAKLLRSIDHVRDPERRAAFRCSIALVAADGTEHVFEGRCPGRIIRNPRGSGGFGYDPVFVPDGYGETFAELAAETKNSISHRARALADVVAWIKASMSAG